MEVMPVGAAVVLLERELRRQSSASVALVHASALIASSLLSLISTFSFRSSKSSLQPSHVSFLRVFSGHSS